VPEFAKFVRKESLVKKTRKENTKGKEIPCRSICWMVEVDEKNRQTCSNKAPFPKVPNSLSGGVLPVSVIRWSLALSPVCPYKKKVTKRNVASNAKVQAWLQAGTLYVNLPG